jgi:hypothetical protein
MCGMTSERLREAAQKIRETAEAVQTETIPAGWTAEGFHYVSGLLEGDLEHITLWSPTVALAVADWLDEEAAHWSPSLVYRCRNALTVADAILERTAAPVVQ